MDQRSPTRIDLIPRIDCFWVLKHSVRLVKVFLASPLPLNSEIQHIHNSLPLLHNIPPTHRIMDRIGVAFLLSRVDKGY